MDAISFVLGIQSQSLRSHQLRELIYRSASMRTEEDGEDGESGDGEQQPTSAYVAAHYQRASGQNVVLKRVYADFFIFRHDLSMLLAFA